ncbi:MAG TPA: hypothetical protein VGG33_15445, partial [Polyangia bacterium]
MSSATHRFACSQSQHRRGGHGRFSSPLVRTRFAAALVILVFAAWAAAANAFAADAGNPDLGVSWSSLLAGPTRAELEQALSKPFANPYDARKPGHPPRSVRTCAELLSLPEGHTAAGTEADFRGFKAQRVRCRAIKILLAAKPARQSHLDGFAASNDDVFAQLPAAMIPAASPEAAAVVEKAARAGSSWGARDREM